MENLDSDAQLLRSVSRHLRSMPRTRGPKAKEKRSDEWHLPGFCAQAKVLTSFGALPIEALRRNDPLKTQDGNFLKVVWVDKIMFDHDYLDAHPEAQPIRLPAGAIGPGLPQRNILVSPAQLVQTAAHHGRPTFRAACDAVGARGIARASATCVTYYLFSCSEPCAVNVDGVWCEIPKSDGLARF